MRLEKGNNPLIYLTRKMWRYSEGNRKSVVLFWSMLIVAICIDLFAQPLIWARIIDTVTKEGITETSIETLMVLLVLTVLVEFASWTFHGPARVIECFNAFHTRANYRKFLLKGILGLDMSWHVEHHSGDTIDKIGKGTTALYSFSEDTFQVMYAFVRLIGSCAVLAYFSPSSMYIVLVMMALVVWMIMRFDRVLVREYEEINHYENNITEGVFDAISNIATVITLRAERLIFEALVHKIEKPLALFKHNVIINEIKWFLTSMCCAVMVALVLGTYLYQNLGSKEGVLVGSVYLLMNYLSKISDVFYTFTMLYGEVLKKRANVQNSEELTQDFKEGNFTNHMLPKDWKELEVSNLTFSYHSEEDGDPHLDDVGLRIIKGERIAFIGETGSGKTTVLKVIRDLYRPKSLTLTADGTIVTEGFGGIRQDIALVPQNPEVFATSILGNITMGAEYPPEMVATFTDMACFSSVAAQLPQGLNTSIKEKGVNLSGGQAQRLALARGLLASNDKDILLLDEPTSSLDAATEMQVYQNIFRGCQGKTIISTIHRLHLLPLFDRIYMFENGRIVASGTLAELLNTSPEFQKLWQKAQTATA